MSDQNGNGKAPPLAALQEEHQLLRARARVAKARRELALTEGAGDAMFGQGWADYLSPWQFRLDPFGNTWVPLGLQLGGPSAHKDGRNPPFASSDADLDKMRGLARWLCTKNDLAIGIMRTLTNYTVKRGFEWDTRPTPGYEEDARAILLADQVKDLIDRHGKLNKLKDRERSAFGRAVRDGDVMTRHFAQNDGTTLVRFVASEQLRDPGTLGPYCSFGIETEEGDVETALAYHVTYNGGGSFERVPADSTCFYKRNVDEEIKRGLSDFYSAGEGLDDVYKLLRNMRKGGGVLAAIAWIEQFESATRDQITAHQGGLRDLNRPRVDHPVTGRPIEYQQMEPGTIVRTQKGKQYLPPPLAGNTTNFTGIVQACLRAVGVRWCMAEYMSSGFMGNVAELSILAAGSPFVNNIECEQDDIGALYLRWRWIAIRNACRAGLIRADLDEVQALVDVHFTPPLVAIANEQEKADVDHKDIAAGVMSLQTRRARIKLDDEQERKNLKEEPLTRVQGKATDVDVQGNPVQPSGQGDKGAPASPGKVRESTGHSYFGDCPRDELGHCIASGGGGSGEGDGPKEEPKGKEAAEHLDDLAGDRAGELTKRSDLVADLTMNLEGKTQHTGDEAAREKHRASIALVAHAAADSFGRRWEKSAAVLERHGASAEEVGQLRAVSARGKAGLEKAGGDMVSAADRFHVAHTKLLQAEPPGEPPAEPLLGDNADAKEEAAHEKRYSAFERAYSAWERRRDKYDAANEKLGQAVEKLENAGGRLDSLQDQWDEKAHAIEQRLLSRLQPSADAAS
jgi:hypothetical protein